MRRHLDLKGWGVIGEVKKRGESGPDIEAVKRYESRHLIVEVKGEIKNPANRSMGLRTLLGQIISRMKKRNPYWIYGIGLPAEQYSVLKKIARGMEDMWKRMKLKVYLVHKNRKVEEKNWKYFLR